MATVAVAAVTASTPHAAHRLHTGRRAPIRRACSMAAVGSRVLRPLRARSESSVPPGPRRPVRTGWAGPRGQVRPIGADPPGNGFRPEVTIVSDAEAFRTCPYCAEILGLVGTWMRRLAVGRCLPCRFRSFPSRRSLLSWNGRAMRGRRTLRILVGAIGLIAILGVAGYFAWFRAESNQLNVVLVTLDTTRADRVGCYGYRPAQTPVIDALASTGVLFEFARTPYPLTLP